MRRTVLKIVEGAVLFQIGAAWAGTSNPPLTLILNGPNPFTNECHALFVDPGAVAVGIPVAMSAGNEHNVAVWGDGSLGLWGGNRYQQLNVPATVTNVVALAAGGAHTLVLQANGTLAGWGENSRGQATIPAGLTNAIAVSGGGEHSLVLKSDGTVVGWGWNAYGQAEPPAGLSNVVAISAGAVHSLALHADGMVTGWGAGTRVSGFPECGQSMVPAGLSNVVAIDAGQVHSLALRADGTVVAWGAAANGEEPPDYGQTGIPAGLSNVVAIAAGGYHNLVLKSDGTVLAWGLNTYGQTNVPANLTNVVAVAAAYRHSLALQADGTVSAWGWNYYGQAYDSGGSRYLSSQVSVKSTIATNVPGTFKITYSAIDLLGNSATATRTVILPALCPGTVDPTFDPTLGGTVPGVEGSFPTPWVWALAQESDGRIYVGGDFKAINSEPRHGLARLLTNGTLDHTYQPPWTNGIEVFSLARQPDGKLLVLWRGSTQNFPAQSGGGVTRLNSDGSLDLTFTNYWSDRWVPYMRVLALQPDGRVLVGGEFMEPRTGIARFNSDGTLDETFTPPLLPAYDGATVKAIGVQPDDKILVGGSSGIDLLRLNRNGTPDQTFRSGVSVSSSVNALHVQPDGRILVGGSLNCDGDGQLRNVIRVQSDGSMDPSFVGDVDIAPLALALQADGRVIVGGECWAQLHDAKIYRLNPDGTQDDAFQAYVDIWYGWPQVTAMQVQPDNSIVIGGVFTNVSGVPAVAIARLKGGPLMPSLRAWGGQNGSGECDVPVDVSDAVLVAAGTYHSLLVKADGAVATWGGNQFGQRDVPAGLSNVAAVAVGPYHTLALKRDGTVVGWGDPSAGRTQVPEGLSDVIAIAAGALHSLALRDDGTVVAWGSNLSSDDNYLGQATVPPGLSNVVAIAAGDWHSIAVRSDGSVVGWGSNDTGETSVPSDLTNAVAVAAAGSWNVAIRADGTLSAWGLEPRIPAGLTNVVAVALGVRHGLALTGHGAVVALGWDSDGQLEAPAGVGNVAVIAAGRYHSLLLMGPIPQLAPSCFSPSLAGDGFTVFVPTMERHHYALEFKDSFAATNWTQLPAIRGYGYGVGRTLRDAAATQAARFYRVAVIR